MGAFIRSCIDAIGFYIMKVFLGNSSGNKSPESTMKNKVMMLGCFYSKFYSGIAIGENQKNHVW